MAYNNPVQRKESACKQLKSETGKPSGLMMEGSAAYTEETKEVEEAKAKKLDKKQEIKNIKGKATEYKPIDNRGVGEMSPYKMDSALHNTGYGDKLATEEEKAEMRKKPAGFNFLPPSNPKDKSSFKQPILDPKSPGYDVGRFLYDADKDGDTILNDLNQDGTFVGRAIKKLFG